MTDDERMQIELNEQIEEKMISRIEELEEKNAENEDRYKRLYAEFDNYKKRTEKDKQNMLVYAKSEIIEGILPVMDSIENAIASGENSNSEGIIEGLELIKNQFQIFMDKHNVEEIGIVGEEFNPEIHEAVAIQPSETLEPNKVINVFRKGYKIKDKILRHAMVIVSN